MMLRLALMVADGVIATCVFVLVSLIRFGDGNVAEVWGLIGIDLRIAAVLFGIGWVAALWYLGLYRMRVRWRLLTEAQDIAKATLVVLIVTLSALFLLKQEDVSRLFLALLFVTQPLVTLAGRTSLRYLFGAIRSRGYNTRYMLVVGSGNTAQDFADRVEARPSLGIKVIGHLSAPGEPVATVTRPVLGTLDEIEAVFHAGVVDEVAVCLPSELARLRRAGQPTGGRRRQDGQDPHRSDRGAAAERDPGRVRRPARSVRGTRSPA